MHIYNVFCNVHIMKGVLKMKKSLKKIIMVVLTFAMMFAMTVPAYAKEAFKILKTNATIYSSKTMENRRCYNPDERIAYIGKRKVVVESSNTKVATVKIKDNAIWATPQKAGTTTITVKTERETYKCTFTVYKYVNPVSSAKVGKLTIKGTAFKKNAIYNLRYSKYKNKSIAFKFNLKKGWKLRGGIAYARSNWGAMKMSPNGSKIKVAGGSGFLAVAHVENIKTGQMERIHIYFK